MGLTTPHLKKKTVRCKTLHRASELDGLFGTTSGSDYGPMAESCEHSNEPSGL